jgi:uncharacterized membrane protein
MATAVPLGQMPDERAHVVRAASLLYGQFVGRRNPDKDGVQGGGFDVDPALARVVGMLEVFKGPVDRVVLEKSRSMEWTNSRFFCGAGGAVAYAPTFYIPEAIGLFAARSFGLLPADSIIVGRCVNVLAFIAVGLTALIMSRRGQILMFCVLTMPMTLNLAASASQDGLLIASTVLAMALSTRYAEPNGERYRAFAAMLLACVIAAKPPYIPLVGVLFLPLCTNTATRYRLVFLQRLILAIVVILPATLWLTISTASVGTIARSFEPYVAGPLWPGPSGAVFNSADAGAQLAVLIAHPLRALSLTWTTFSHDPWMMRMVIGLLGLMDIQLPTSYYQWWLWASIAAVLCGFVNDGARAGFRCSAADAAFVILICSLCVILVYVGQYLTWTQVGVKRVDGVQGRYLLPIFPVLALGIPAMGFLSSHKTSAKIPRWVMIFMPTSAAIAGIIWLPLLVVRRYYLQ